MISLAQRLRRLPSRAGASAPEIGEAFEGGYYVGIMTYDDGDYYLIVAPQAAEATLQWKTTDDATSATDSYHDGLANSNAMNNTSHPAAQHCLSGTWGGQSDWYLPARDEFELCYRNLKPTTDENRIIARPDGSGGTGENINSNPNGAAYTVSVPGRTPVARFQQGGSEALSDAGTWYWTSTECATATRRAWIQSCLDGYQTYNFKNLFYTARPVRRVKI